MRVVAHILIQFDLLSDVVGIGKGWQIVLIVVPSLPFSLVSRLPHALDLV